MTGGVHDPVGRLQRDAVRVGEVDRPDEAVVDDVGDFAVRVLQPFAEVDQRLFVDEVEREVVELRGFRHGDPGRFGVALGRDIAVLEERERRVGTELEEVVPERRRAHGGDQTGTEHARVEADGLVHVRGHEGEVVDAAPTRRRRARELVRSHDRLRTEVAFPAL